VHFEEDRKLTSTHDLGYIGFIFMLSHRGINQYFSVHSVNYVAIRPLLRPVSVDLEDGLFSSFLATFIVVLLSQHIYASSRCLCLILFIMFLFGFELLSLMSLAPQPKCVNTGRLTIIGLVYPVCATCPYHPLSSLVISCPRVGILS
jgi:hypothetical protein